MAGLPPPFSTASSLPPLSTELIEDSGRAHLCGSLAVLWLPFYFISRCWSGLRSPYTRRWLHRLQGMEASPRSVLSSLQPRPPGQPTSSPSPFLLVSRLHPAFVTPCLCLLFSAFLDIVISFLLLSLYSDSWSSLKIQLPHPHHHLCKASPCSRVHRLPLCLLSPAY